METSTSSFGKRLKILRQKKGLTQRQVAEKIGVTAASLSAYENEIQKPSIDVVVNIVRNFNVSLPWLCGFHDDTIFDPTICDLQITLSYLRALISSGLLTVKTCDSDTTTLIATGSVKDYFDTVKRVAISDADNPYWNPVIGLMSEYYAEKISNEILSNPETE